MIKTHLNPILLSVSFFAAFNTTTATVSAQDIISNKTFHQILDLRGLVFAKDLIFNSPAASLLGCSAQCSKRMSCVGFTFRPPDLASSGRSQCRGHSSRKMNSGQGQQVIGAKTFLCHRCKGINEESRVKIPVKTTVGVNVAYESEVLGLNLVAYTGWCEEDFTLYITREGTVQVPWWLVDFGTHWNFYGLRVTVRNDYCYGKLRGVSITLYTDSPLTTAHVHSALCYDPKGPAAASVTDQLTCGQGPTRTRFVMATNTTPSDAITCGVNIVILPTKI